MNNSIFRSNIDVGSVTTNQLNDLGLNDFKRVIHQIFTDYGVRMENRKTVHFFRNNDYELIIKESNGLKARIKLTNILRAMYPNQRVYNINLKAIVDYQNEQKDFKK